LHKEVENVKRYILVDKSVKQQVSQLLSFTPGIAPGWGHLSDGKCGNNPGIPGIKELRNRPKTGKREKPGLSLLGC